MKTLTKTGSPWILKQKIIILLQECCYFLSFPFQAEYNSGNLRKCKPVISNRRYLFKLACSTIIFPVSHMAVIALSCFKSS